MDVAAVRVGDRSHDRQSEAGSPTGRGLGGVGESLGGGQPAERFEQARDFVGRDGWSGVLDGEVRVVFDSAGADGDLAVFGQVVTDGVVEQVLGEPFQQYWVALDRGGLQVGVDIDPGGVRVALGFGGDVPRDVGEVYWGGVGDALFAAGEGEQAVDEPFVALVDGKQGGAELTE
jgi:hypothetical protein